MWMARPASQVARMAEAASSRTGEVVTGNLTGGADSWGGLAGAAMAGTTRERERVIFLLLMGGQYSYG